MSWKWIVLESLKILAYDSWSSPESVATAIVSILGALSAAATAIIATYRNMDRKNGKDRCRFTNKKLNKDEDETDNKLTS